MTLGFSARRCALVCLAFAVVAVAVARPLSPASASSPPPWAWAYGDQLGTKSAPLIVETVESKSDADEKAAAVKHREQDASNSRNTVFITSGLLAIAVVQAILFVYQMVLLVQGTKLAKLAANAATDAARAAKESSDLARQEFISTHRPELRVRHVWPSGELWDGGKISVTAQVVNVGVTPAKLIDFSVRTTIELPDRPLRSPPSYGGSVPIDRIMDSGDHADLPSIESHSINDAENTAIRYGKQRLYCFGYVRYSDGEGRVRTTAFCRVLQPPSGTGANSKIGHFVRSNPENEDYEYRE